jgi:hypothetical protein
VRRILDMEKKAVEANVRRCAETSDGSVALLQQPVIQQVCRGPEAVYPRGMDYAAGLVLNRQD